MAVEKSTLGLTSAQIIAMQTQRPPVPASWQHRNPVFVLAAENQYGVIRQIENILEAEEETLP